MGTSEAKIENRKLEERHAISPEDGRMCKSFFWGRRVRVRARVDQLEGERRGTPELQKIV